MRVVIVGILSLVAINASAANQFCASVAVEAAKAIANVNGSVSEITKSSQSQDGKLFWVSLQEKNIGEDIYSVKTSGGHDCIVYSVKIKGKPTRRP